MKKEYEFEYVSRDYFEQFEMYYYLFNNKTKS